ncbi:MAG: hypothetical protein ACPGPD_05150, partial [Pseudomonadales bacterium]
EETLGRVFLEMQPYGLWPVRQYFTVHRRDETPPCNPGVELARRKQVQAPLPETGQTVRRRVYMPRQKPRALAAAAG